MQDFKKLDVWWKSYRLSLEVYKATRAFPKEEAYGLTSQARRASVSIPANIAEGCGRYSDGELLRFLDIAMGSGSELECYLMLAQDLGYLNKDTSHPLEERLLETKRMLNALIQKIRQEHLSK